MEKIKLTGIMLLIFMLFYLALHYLPAFLLFSLLLLIFFILKIDSRFFILAAILHLWFAPFMLIINNKEIANQTAIYAYYYLIIGVLYQFFEKKPKLNLEFFLKKLAKINYVYPAVILIAVILINHFHTFMGIIARNVLLYITSLMAVMLIYQALK